MTPRTAIGAWVTFLFKFPSWIIIISILSRVACNSERNFSKCNSKALGMETGEIKNESITASSYYDKSVQGIYGRIRTNDLGGAWCPKGPVSPDTHEYLEIDLSHLRVINMVETQGRFGDGQGQEFAESYKLEYQREEGGDWFKFKDRMKKETFRGNTNTYIGELRKVDPPIIARKIRFVPYADHPTQICMRVEVYGCDWNDSFVWYSLPQGDVRGSDINLIDQTYDGRVVDHYLVGGLGQLADGEYGDTSIKAVSYDVKGYKWLGYRNDSFNGGPIEMVVKFDTVRNFTQMRLHTHNNFNKEIRVFKMAELDFSISGKYFPDDPVIFKFQRDDLMEIERPILINIPHRIGRYVRVKLYFAAKWILLSEMEFHSEIALGPFVEETLPSGQTPLTDEMPFRPLDTEKPMAKNNTMDEDLKAGLPTNGNGSGKRNGTHAGKRESDDEIIGIVIGVLATLILLLFILMMIIIIRQRRSKYLHSTAKVQIVEPTDVYLAGPAAGTIAEMSDDIGTIGTLNGKTLNGKLYTGLANANLDDACENSYILTLQSNHQRRVLPDLPIDPESSDTNMSRDYATPGTLKSPVIVNIPPPPPPPPRRPHIIYGVTPTYPIAHDLDMGEVVYSSDSEVPNIQGVSGSNVYAVPETIDPHWNEAMYVTELPKDNIKFVEKLGEGQFGEVHLCEAIRLSEYLSEEFLRDKPWSRSRSNKVVVKMLKKNIDQHARYDFMREVKIMSQLTDPNIVSVIGICSKDDPLCVVVEYMKYGDLNQYLKDHVPETTTMSRRKGARILSQGCLNYIAMQIASGMSYLENLNVCHRDLACRNCLVGSHYTIKISDFGMSRNLYSADYYKIEGKAVLPIRWMAWESVVLGRFSSKSDVWSFGVTLWEIYTFAREQPFEHWSDEQVIENCTHFFHNDTQVEYLDQPVGCPKELYDLIKECWNRESTYRPAFNEIRMFLDQKNVGYNPVEDS